MIFVFFSNIVLAQHCSYFIDTFSIRHYACLENKQRIIVYKYHEPKDLCSSYDNYFAVDISKFKDSSDMIMPIITCTDDVLGLYKLVNINDLDTNCICYESNKYQLGRDSMLMSTYHPLEGIVLYSPNNMKKFEKVKWKKGCSIFAIIPKKQMSKIWHHTSKCNVSCSISNSDFPVYLYVEHPGHQVSYLIEISTNNIRLNSSSQIP